MNQLEVVQNKLYEVRQMLDLITVVSHNELADSLSGGTMTGAFITATNTLDESLSILSAIEHEQEKLAKVDVE